MDPLDGSSSIDVNVSVGTIYTMGYRAWAPVRGAEFRTAGGKRSRCGIMSCMSSCMLRLRLRRRVLPAVVLQSHYAGTVLR